MLTLREPAARKYLEACKNEAAQQGVDLDTRLRLGTGIYGEILEEAQEIKPDLIILGRRGRTGLDRLMMGSVTARVIGHSPVNVLVVPKDVRLDFQKLLIASDGSPYSEAALAAALTLAWKTGAVLLGACVARDESELPTARDILEKVKTTAARESVALEPRLLQGRPYEALVKVARDEAVNLIILGSHGRTGLKRLLMGSVAERVIGQAPCPVLVVKGVE